MYNKKLAEYLADYIEQESDVIDFEIPEDVNWLAEIILNGIEAFESINDLEG